MKGNRPSTSPHVRVLDVAHPPLPPARVEELLLQAWNEARNAPGIRVIKVIHGYGSTGKGGGTQLLVRNWGSQMRTKVRGVICGEDYSMYAQLSQAMRREVGSFDDSELDAGNRGITYLWIK